MSKLTIELDTRNPEEVAQAFVALCALYRQHQPGYLIEVVRTKILGKKKRAAAPRKR